jgi:hypothetical protein
MRGFLITSFCVTVGLIGSACTEKAKFHEIWIAKAVTPVYASENDGEEKILFHIDMDDICTPLQEVFDKALLHTEILCKQGQGWIVNQENFNVHKSIPKKHLFESRRVCKLNCVTAF